MRRCKVGAAKLFVCHCWSESLKNSQAQDCNNLDTTHGEGLRGRIPLPSAFLTACSKVKYFDACKCTNNFGAVKKQEKKSFHFLVRGDATDVLFRW